MGRGRQAVGAYPLTEKDSIVCAFRFTKDELAVLEQQAKELGLSRNKMAREAIRTYLGMQTLRDQQSKNDKGLTVT